MQRHEDREFESCMCILLGEKITNNFFFFKKYWDQGELKCVTLFRCPSCNQCPCVMP